MKVKLNPRLLINNWLKSHCLLNHYQSLTVIHLHTRSLKKHYEQLEALVNCLESPPNIICLTETWLSAKNDPGLYNLSNYTACLSKSRNGRRGGIMVQNTSEVALKGELVSEIEENLLIHVKVGIEDMILLTLYNPPRSDKLVLITELDKLLERLTTKYDQTLVCGDFNIDTLKADYISSKYMNMIASNGYHFCINKPTRLDSSSAICLDHFFVKGVRVINDNVLTKQSYSDHAPIVLTTGIDGENTTKYQKFRDTSFLKSPKKATCFLETLETSLSAITYNGHSISKNFENFQTTFNEVFQIFAPMPENKQNKKMVPMWFDKSLRNQVSKRNLLHRKRKKNKSDCRQLSNFKAARAKVEQLIKKNEKRFLSWKVH